MNRGKGETVMTEPTKYTLITGASSGIGRAIAVRLSQERNVILNGRDAAKLAETKSLCAPGNGQLAWAFDFNNLDALESSLTDLLTENGAVIDVFIHSAGRLTLLPFRTLTRVQMAEMMDVNFYSAALIVQALLRKGPNRKRLGNIIFISSTVSNFGAKAFSIYSASKGALDSLMRCLAVELAPDVRLNSILPGGLKTPMTDKMLADLELAGRMEKDYPLGLGTVDRVADLAAFLVSDGSRWITGQQFVIDGGRTINITA
jgi:NAD(P)-dependent dehydrogenase (short-subunit alcohol dehydrogenase family)